MLAKLNHALVLLLGILSLFFNVTLEACSRILWNNSVNRVAARTMDLSVDEKPTFTVLPRGLSREGCGDHHSIKWSSKYGSVVVTAFEANAISEGMNEKGLSAHLLLLEGTEYELRDSRPSLSNGLWIQYMLDNFSSVKDVIDSLKSFQVVSTEVGGRYWELHACLEDPSGDSAIIEYVDGKIVVYHGPQHVVMTNEPTYDIQIKNLQRYRYFGGDLPLPDDIDSESRFVRCAVLLKTLPDPKNLKEAIDRVFEAIRTVQAPFRDTRWISAIDVTNLTYYFCSISTGNIFWIDLKNLDFLPRQSVRSINPHDPSFSGEISNRFIPHQTIPA